jgi:hypothetical protein
VSITVCLFANTISYPEGGGHLWVYLNWALGLRAAGCKVIWAEGVSVPPDSAAEAVQAQVGGLKRRLAPYGFEDVLALGTWSGGPLPPSAAPDCPGLEEAAAAADLLLNFNYYLAADAVGRFRRSALVDIDPGLLQAWIGQGHISPARHDLYLTTGETVGQPGSRIHGVGFPWTYTPPCVALDWWPPSQAPREAPFTTVSHWYASEWVEDGKETYRNDKRAGFQPFLDLPGRTRQLLELALCFGDGDEDEREGLLQRGWRVRAAGEVASTPWAYQRYIRSSRGEFSCAKPSTVRMQNAWISDRTLCYLASGKPAVVQHTGPSRSLPDAAGLFRFRTLEEAARHLETAAADYEHHSRLARALAEEIFDAREVATRVLERALA